ncbi:uncharacterized protein ACN63O_009922 [Diretmus argenteus]
MSPEDPSQDPPLGFSSTRIDLTLSCGDLDGSQESGRRSRARSSLHARTTEGDISCHGEFADTGRSPLLLKTLMEAETAANSAAIQLVSFKDAMEDEFADSRQSAPDKRRIKRQRSLLLVKLEDFNRINMSVRQKLKQLQEAEAHRVDTDKQIDVLLKKITQAESENLHLKRDLTETEKTLDELMDRRRKEQENMESAVQISKSVEATRAHLQGQLRNKEGDNNRLTVQLRTLERTLTQQRMELDDLKGAISSFSEKAAQDKESLKKATRAQKQRAERFEAAVDKCYTQLREKDVQLANVRLERDSWRSRQQQMTEERDRLAAQIELLKCQMKELTVRLQRETDGLSAAKEILMQRVEKLSTENGDLNINNAALKVSIAELQQQLADSESVLTVQRDVSQERKHQAQQYQRQVAELQAEVDDLRIKYKSLLRETESERDRKDEEVEEVRQDLQGRVEELEAYPELLSAAEQSLFEYRENLQRSERKCSEKSESIRQLQVKMDSQAKKLRSSVEMKESIHEANSRLQETVNSLQKRMEELQQENLDMVRRITDQEEALSYSNHQLDQRSAECQALNRQLEAALSDIRQQVNKVKDTAVSREGALQTRVLELEAEKRKGETELKLLRQSKVSAEKQFEVRLRELQLSLDQSESHKQSIQNYVDFLKNSYATMFDEGLPPSSYFLK